MKHPYLSLEEMLDMVEEPAASSCKRLLQENQVLFSKALGGSHNHHTWKGGYLDHIQESMNIGIVLYLAFKEIRPLSFSLSDVLLVLFLHDLEKPWRYTQDKKTTSEMGTTQKRHLFRSRKIQEYGITLTSDQENAMRYVDGELDDYTPLKRMMKPLATLCHLADISSARIWFDHPLLENDSWGKRRGS